MSPKTPTELKAQIEKENEQSPAVSGNERTAEGLEVQTPKRSEFISNLEKASKPSG